MMRIITPIILIGLGVGVFFVFTDPIYNQIKEQRTKIASYNKALDNSKELEKQRDLLTDKFNAISKDDLLKLNKLLPSSIDNIRLILEIEQIAVPYGLSLKDVKYGATDTSKTATPGEVGVVQGGGVPQSSSKDYGVWDLSFSTTGTYNNFLDFTRDIQSNLRIVDIVSIQFSSATTATARTVPAPGATPVVATAINSSLNDLYTYNFKIRTYWLKN